MTPQTATSPDPESELLEQCPVYAATAVLDDLRRTDYSRLDAEDHVYLDYTGGGMYADSPVRLHAEMLAHHVLGNPATPPASVPRIPPRSWSGHGKPCSTIPRLWRVHGRLHAQRERCTEACPANSSRSCISRLRP